MIEDSEIQTHSSSVKSAHPFYERDQKNFVQNYLENTSLNSSGNAVDPQGDEDSNLGIQVESPSGSPSGSQFGSQFQEQSFKTPFDPPQLKIAFSPSIQEQNIQELLLQSLDGDQMAYELFLKEISDLLRIYIRKSQRGNITLEKLEDLVQEVLMSIHTKLSTYRADLPVVPWVLAIAKNRVIDSSRAERRQSQSKFLNFEIENLFYSKIESDLTDQYSAQQELENVLSHLSERQRQVLILAKGEQLSILEIAEKFKMSVSSVKVTIHRAIGALRDRKRRRA